MQRLQDIIETAFENRANLTPSTADETLKQAVYEVMTLLNTGKARVAEKVQGHWQVHEWLKKAVLLFI